MWVFNFDHVEFHQFLKRLERLWKAITCFHFVQDLNTSERSEIKSWKPCLLCKVIHQRLKSCLFLDRISGDTSDMNEALRMLRLLCLLLLCGERAARPAKLCKAWLIKAEGRKKNMKNYPKQSNSKENRINIHQFHVISYKSHQSVQFLKNGWFVLKYFLPVRGRSVLANNPVSRSIMLQLKIIDPTCQALGLKCTRPAINKIWYEILKMYEIYWNM